MEIIGLVGGIGSGKSLVSRLFEENGAVLLNADVIGHEVLTRPEVIAALRARWGNSVVKASTTGGVEPDRSRIAALIFGSEETALAERDFLNQLVHPLIHQEVVDCLTRYRKEGRAIAILDAPLLFESGWNSLCDRIIFVDAEETVRWSRVQKRGWSFEQFKAREQSQLSLEQKKQHSDFIIDNNGSVSQTREQIESLFRSSKKFSSLIPRRE